MKNNQKQLGIAKYPACFPLFTAPIVLFKIKNIRFYKSTQHSGAWYDIRFEEDMSLSVTQLHAFVTIRGNEKIFIPTNLLLPGDKIWVDTSAFGADKSLYKTRLH